MRGATMVLEYKCVLQPVNVFGERIGDDSEDANEEELDFMPVPIDFTEKKYGWSIFLNIGSYNENKNNYLDIPSDSMTGTQQSILSGSVEKGSEYFDSIYIGWWPGVTRSGARMPYPFLDEIEIKEDWSGIMRWNCFSMRLNKKDGSSLHSVIHKIDPKMKVNFKFLSDTIPDVRAVFYIRGKRYICEKLTVTFTENGMSQLIKGVFYPLID